MSSEKKISWLLRALFGLSLLYAIFSYALTDPNLVLISWPPYWRFQQWMWQTFLHQRELLTQVYVLFITGFFVVYLFGLKLTTHTQSLSSKKLLFAYLLAVSPLFFSYNALSHDVFNYIFNAKMVLVYQANPHVQVALDFTHDNWTRFMHNTHTPAPYGYGWTALSLIPYAIGFNTFLLTWLLFRGWAVLSIVLLFWVLQKISLTINKKSLSLPAFWLVFLNPVLFIEVIANQHNDLWMVPALAALWLLFDQPTKQTTPKLLASSLLFGFSTLIKFATLVITPVWLLVLMRRVIPKLRNSLSWERLSWWSSILLFLPLLTLRSQQFLPWYLLWSLVWLPFIKKPWWRHWLITFSLTAMLRYVPWLWVGEYTQLVLTQQKWLVWGGGIGLWLMSQLWFLTQRVRYNREQ